MIAEAAVVRVLLNRHDLHGGIAGFFDARQDVIFEFGVGADFLGVLRHADMRFVNQKRVRVNLEALVVPLVLLRRIPHLRGENFSVVVLHDALTPCGNAFAFAAVPANAHLVKVAVFHFVGGQFEFPVAVVDSLATIFFGSLPAVEVAD